MIHPRSVLAFVLGPLAAFLVVILLLPQAAPVVYAQPSGWVEIIEERTRTGKVFFDPSRPGVRAVDVSVGKVHYNGPDWVDIDNTLVPSTASVPSLGMADLEMVRDDYEFYALQTLNTIPLWLYRNRAFLAQYITLNPQGLGWTNDQDDVELLSMPQSVLGTLSGGSLSWENAYGPGRNLTLSAQAGRLAKVLALDAMPPAPAQYILDGGNPALELQFIFATPSGPNSPEIWVDGVLWGQSARTETVEAIEFRKDGDTIFSFAKPTAFDSGFGVASPSFVLTKQGPNLRVAIRVPLSFLENAVYPVFIDPSIDETVIGAVHDGRSHGPSFSTVNSYVGNVIEINDAFFWWDTVAIDQGETITVAYFTYEVGWSAGGDPKTNIYMEDSDDAVFPTSNAEHAADVRTTAFTVYDDMNPVPPATPTQSPSIVSVVQEVLDRPGWSNNNAMMVLWDDDGSVGATLDAVTQQNMILHIEWAAWENTAPTITDGIAGETVLIDLVYARGFNATDPDTNQTLAWELNTTDAPFTITVWNGGNRTTWVNATPDTLGSFYVNVTVGDDAALGNETDWVNYTLNVVETSTIWETYGFLIYVGFALMFTLLGLFLAGTPGLLISFFGGLLWIFAGFDFFLRTLEFPIAILFIFTGSVLIFYNFWEGLHKKR